MDPNGGHDYTYRTYPARWRMLGIVFFINLVTQVFFTTLMPIATAASLFFGVSLTAINWVALVWLALFLPCTVFAGWAMHKFGLRRCMILSGFVLLVGAVIRALTGFFAEHEVDGRKSKKGVGAYVVLLLGTMVMGLVQPIVMSSTTLTAAAWFCEKQRNLANSIVRPALWASNRCKQRHSIRQLRPCTLGLCSTAMWPSEHSPELWMLRLAPNCQLPIRSQHACSAMLSEVPSAVVCSTQHDALVTHATGMCPARLLAPAPLAAHTHCSLY